MKTRVHRKAAKPVHQDIIAMLESIKNTLNISDKDMGDRLGALSSGPKVSSCRIGEWRRGCRPLPDWVVPCAVVIVIDEWRAAQARGEKEPEATLKYLEVLAPTLALAYRLLLEARACPSLSESMVLLPTRLFQELQNHFEESRGVKLPAIILP